MYEIMLGVPSAGVICEESAQASWLASVRHKVHRMPNTWSNGNFNLLWAMALNAGSQKKITHYAMMHTDLRVLENEPGLRWLDQGIEEMDKHDADFISVPNRIKDETGTCSCGIGNIHNRWNPWRRFTTSELLKYPLTFNAAMIGYDRPGRYLLHNNAICIWDMRKPLWYQPAEENEARMIFNYTQTIRLHQDGLWKVSQDSEDWQTSRQLYEMQARTFITRRIPLLHQSVQWLPNFVAGTQEHDEATKAQWQTDFRR